MVYVQVYGFYYHQISCYSWGSQPTHGATEEFRVHTAPGPILSEALAATWGYNRLLMSMPGSTVLPQLGLMSYARVTTGAHGK